MKTREEVAVEDCWNLKPLYASQQDWEQVFKKFAPNSQKAPYWPALQDYQGKLEQGPEKVKEMLDLLMGIDRELSKLYTYAHLRHDEDIANPQYKKSYEQILSLTHAFAQETAWIQPELISLADSLLSQYLASPTLKDYHFYIEKMIRMKMRNY
jgi:oligoendopeptidase F